jgi:hypothetical protein
VARSSDEKVSSSADSISWQRGVDRKDAIEAHISEPPVLLGEPTLAERHAVVHGHVRKSSDRGLDRATVSLIWRIGRDGKLTIADVRGGGGGVGGHPLDVRAAEVRGGRGGRRLEVAALAILHNVSSDTSSEFVNSVSPSAWYSNWRTWTEYVEYYSGDISFMFGISKTPAPVPAPSASLASSASYILLRMSTRPSRNA